jgi:hypothetical protein
MDIYFPQNNMNILIESVVLKSEIKDPFSQLIDSFEPITLAEMDTVRLMNRVDTKYIIKKSQLPGLLEKARKDYRMVEVNGKRMIPYSTVYFDTKDAEMYMMHHNGKLNRNKIRMRSYVDSGISFLEVKAKSNKGRTTKNRIRISNEMFESMHLKESEYHFLNEMNCEMDSIKPQIQNTFRRITLVDKNKTERITLDTRLSFQNLSTGLRNNLPELVVIEMKQDAASHSQFKNYLNEIRVKPGSLSKYCLGMMLVRPDLKSNGFKNKLRKISKITDM